MHPTPLSCDVAEPACPKRVRRKEARPGELIEAALALFVEKGFAATRVEEVAQRAGVSKGTLFLYFASKEDLFRAVVRANISNQLSAMERELQGHEGSSEALLRRCMHHWWTHIGSTKAAGISKLIMSEASNFPELAHFYQSEVVQPAEQLIRRILERGERSGEFRAVHPVYGVFSVVAPMLFLVLWQHSLGACGACSVAIEPQAYIDSQIDVMLYGLRAAAPAPVL